METAYRNHEGVYIVYLKGRLDGTGAGQLDTLLQKLIPEMESKLVLDYAGVVYISSSGLRVIVKLAKDLRLAGKELELVNVNSDVYKVFKMTGFTGIINISRINQEDNSAIGEEIC